MDRSEEQIRISKLHPDRFYYQEKNMGFYIFQYSVDNTVNPPAWSFSRIGDSSIPSDESCWRFVINKAEDRMYCIHVRAGRNHFFYFNMEDIDDITKISYKTLPSTFLGVSVDSRADIAISADDSFIYIFDTSGFFVYDIRDSYKDNPELISQAFLEEVPCSMVLSNDQAYLHISASSSFYYKVKLNPEYFMATRVFAYNRIPDQTWTIGDENYNFTFDAGYFKNADTYGLLKVIETNGFSILGEVSGLFEY